MRVEDRVGNSVRFYLGWMAAPLLLLAMTSPSQAEVKSYTSSGTAAEVAWTTCPNTAQFDGQLCNYTVMYAATGNRFQRFVIIQMANLRLYTNNRFDIAAIASGYMQPATSVTITRATLANALASGAAYLYGNCADPNDLRTCYYFGVGAVSARWTASGGTTSWQNSNSVADPANIRYAVSTTAAARPASATGSATFNGGFWALGRTLVGRVLRFDISETLTCPSQCPQTAPSASALLGADPSKDGPANGTPHVESGSQLRNWGDVDSQTEAKPQSLFGGGPFDFSPLGQVRSIFTRATPH